MRIAARGDGVTESGRHIAFAAPGDLVDEDGTIESGQARQVPPCRHFPQCGGCRLQHLTDAAFAHYCEDRVSGALAQHGLRTEVRPAQLSLPRTRRRATLHALRSGGRIAIGFHEAASKRVIDMRECHILAPELFRLIEPLRRLFATMVKTGQVADAQMTLADQGVDLGLSGVRGEGLEAAEALTSFGRDNALARITLDEGYGAQARWEPEPVTITLSGVPVALPAGAFLQATKEGEAALVGSVREALVGARRTADLFAGLGTFSLGLEGAIVAAEAGRDAIFALGAAAKRSGRTISVMHRDLYRNPLQPAELASLDAVVLDPPRAGAVEQARALGSSTVPKIAYVSCNPATFARDAEILVGGGYRLAWVRPVGQFRWSTHVELAACFSR